MPRVTLPNPWCCCKRHLMRYIFQAGRLNTWVLYRPLGTRVVGSSLQ